MSQEQSSIFRNPKTDPYCTAETRADFLTRLSSISYWHSDCPLTYASGSRFSQTNLWKKRKYICQSLNLFYQIVFASLSEEFKCLFAKIDCFIFYIGKTYWPKNGIMFILVMKYSSSNQWTLVPLLQKKLTKCHVCARKTPNILFKWDMCVLSEMCIKCSYFSSH